MIRWGMTDRKLGEVSNSQLEWILANQAESERPNSGPQATYSIELLKTWTWSQRDLDSNLTNLICVTLGKLFAFFEPLFSHL